MTGNLTEDEKDSSYFRRSSWNPMNWFSQRHNEAFENGNTAYHSTSVHGAQNSLANIRDRHFFQPGAAPMSQMTNTLTGAVGTIRRQAHSSRFASSSWEKHSRNDAMSHFEQQAAAAGHTVQWNAAPPPFGAPAVGTQTSQFHMSYGNALTGDHEVGVTSHKPGPAAAAGPVGPSQSTNHVRATVNYHQTGPNTISAWVGQLFPTPAAGAAANTGPVATANHQPNAWRASDFNPLG